MRSGIECRLMTYVPLCFNFSLSLGQLQVSLGRCPLPNVARARFYQNLVRMLNRWHLKGCHEHGTERFRTFAVDLLIVEFGFLSVTDSDIEQMASPSCGCCSRLRAGAVLHLKGIYRTWDIPLYINSQQQSCAESPSSQANVQHNVHCIAPHRHTCRLLHRCIGQCDCGRKVSTMVPYLNFVELVVSNDLPLVSSTPQSIQSRRYHRLHDRNHQLWWIHHRT